jgi:hypothetical protein
MIGSMALGTRRAAVRSDGSTLAAGEAEEKEFAIGEVVVAMMVVGKERAMARARHHRTPGTRRMVPP